MTTDLQNIYMAFFGLSPKEAKEKVFYKTNILPESLGGFRASVTKFHDGNSSAVMIITDTIEEAEEFVRKHINATNV